MEHKIIGLFLENGNEPLSGMEIARRLQCDFKTAYKYIAQLVRLNLLSKKTVGKSNQYQFTHKYHPFVAQAQYDRLVKVRKQSEIESIYLALHRVKSSFFIALLFGSRSRGTHKPTSDIDLCMIADEQIQKEITTELELLPFKTHLFTFTHAEFKHMLNVKKENVAHEIMKNQIILHGIDSFYWMVHDDH